MITHHAALIYAMILVAASDRDMKNVELGQIGRLVKSLPAFADYDVNELPRTAQECAVMLQVENGLDTTLGAIANALPPQLRPTAYLVACEIAAIDGRLPVEESRVLARLRHALHIDKLMAAAIERATAARFQMA